MIQADILVNFHQNWSRVVLIYAIAVALWGIFLFLRKRNPPGGYLGALIIAEGIVLIQGVIGILLVVGGHRPHNGLHFLYGFVAAIALPGAYGFSSLSHGGSERRDSLIMGLASLFLFGISIRAITTAGS